MLRVTIFCILLVLAAWLNGGIFAGKAKFLNFPNLKIVEGRNTSIEEVPYQIAIEEDGDQFCGGSIITTKHVLTAAHCFLGIDGPEHITIRTGSTIRNSGGKVIQVFKIARHPDFDIAPFDNDIVILELAEEIELSETSQIIALADVEPDEGTEALASGWGNINAEEDRLEILQSVILPIVDRVKCNRSYSVIVEPIPVTDLKICAGGKDPGICRGDSGGPLVVDGNDGKKVLVGAASFQHKHACATYGYPGGFTNIAHPGIRKFILENAGV